ncbi:hypothetical protein HDV00_000416 [Rhizophlyctis rosea]|nr:hypothetical protein HDV00_000416 [Rhizophlyctis rosea]
MDAHSTPIAAFADHITLNLEGIQVELKQDVIGRRQGCRVLDFRDVVPSSDEKSLVDPATAGNDDLRNCVRVTQEDKYTVIRKDDKTQAKTEENSLPSFDVLLFSDFNDTKRYEYLPNLVSFQSQTLPSEHTPLGDAAAQQAWYSTFNKKAKAPPPIPQIDPTAPDLQNFTTTLHVTLQSVSPQQHLILKYADPEHNDDLKTFLRSAPNKDAAITLQEIIGKAVKPLTGGKMPWVYLLNLLTSYLRDGTYIVLPYLQYLYFFTRRTTVGISRRAGAILFIGMGLDLGLKLLANMEAGGAMYRLLGIEGRMGLGMRTVWSCMLLRLPTLEHGSLTDGLEGLVAPGRLNVGERRSDGMDRRVDWITRGVLFPLISVATNFVLTSTPLATTHFQFTSAALQTYTILQLHFNTITKQFAGHYKLCAIIPSLLQIILIVTDIMLGSLSLFKVPRNRWIDAVTGAVMCWQALTLPSVDQNEVEEDVEIVDGVRMRREDAHLHEE